MRQSATTLLTHDLRLTNWTARPCRRGTLCLLLGLVLLLAGCGGGDEPSRRLPTRTPMPTFTPTPFVINPQGTVVAAAAAPVSPAQGAETAPGSAPVPVDTPAAASVEPTPEPQPVADTPAPQAVVAVVTSPQINVRTGPGTAYDWAGQVNRGMELTIVGRNAQGDWLQVCCVEGQTVWVAGWLVDTQGPVDAVAVAGDVPPPPPTNTPAPARPTEPPAPAPPTDTPAPSFIFAKYGNLLPRVSSNQVISFFGALFTPNADGAVAGYLMVVEGPAGRTEATFGQFFQHGDPGLESEFIYNAKAEFIGVAPGVYTVWVADTGGNRVGEPYQYTVEGNNRTFLPRWKQN